MCRLTANYYELHIVSPMNYSEIDYTLYPLYSQEIELRMNSVTFEVIQLVTELRFNPSFV